MVRLSTAKVCNMRTSRRQKEAKPLPRGLLLRLGYQGAFLVRIDGASLLGHNSSLVYIKAYRRSEDNVSARDHQNVLKIPALLVQLTFNTACRLDFQLKSAVHT